MQHKTEKDIFKAYKKADNITRDHMWIRYTTFRKAFNEIDRSMDNGWQVTKIIPWTASFKSVWGMGRLCLTSKWFR